LRKKIEKLGKEEGRIDLSQIPKEQIQKWEEALEKYSTTVTNPPVQIVLVQHQQGFQIPVVRDDFLKAGSKQRALIPILKNHAAKEFVYAGPIYGYAQVALSYTAKLAGKKATLFLEKVPQRHPLTQIAVGLGANVMEIEHGYLKKVQEEAEKYCANCGAENIPFGLYAPEFLWTLKTQIQRALPLDLKEPQRVWVVAGSGTLVSALHEIWPNSEFLIVQIGKWIRQEILAGMKHQLFIAPERFQDDAQVPPPYPSSPNYDAKLWRFVEIHGQEGDLIWNVAGIAWEQED